MGLDDWKSNDEETADPDSIVANGVRIREKCRLLPHQENKTVLLNDPTPEEIKYLLSHMYELQRGKQEDQVEKIVHDLLRDGHKDNGANIFIHHKDGKNGVADGQQRLHAWFKFILLGGDPPPIIRLFISRDETAISTLHSPKQWGVQDIATLEGLPRLSGGVIAGLCLEANDFVVVKRRSNKAKLNMAHADPKMVKFIASFPQSGGARKGMNTHAGIYAAASRARRAYSEELVRKFFTALILAEHCIDKVEVEVLKDIVKALASYPSTGGAPSIMRAATLAMRGFLAWVDGRRLKKQDLLAPDGSRDWPASMERPVPIEDPRKMERPMPIEDPRRKKKAA